MGILDAIILGIVQGVSEFLPISSSGHLVLLQNILTPGPHSIMFDLAVHVGTVLSIITVYRKSLFQVLKDVFQAISKRQKNAGLMLAFLVVVANVPTAIIGFGFKDQFESLFSNLTAVGIGFFVTGVLLFLTKKKSGPENDKALDMHDFSGVGNLNIWRALLIGVAQGMAIAPGISRSGSTIAAALLAGVDRKTAAMFSFILSIPPILGASLLELKDATAQGEMQMTVMLAGFFFAYVSGLIGLKVILKFVKKGRLEIFSYYLWALSAYIIFAS